MTAKPEPTARKKEPGPVQNGMLRGAYGQLGGFAQRMAQLEKAVDLLGRAADEQSEAAARRLKRQIREFEPSVTMIGQVKAGKTTLVNTLVGWPGILPADVNPWTSVVTSLHMAPQSRPAANRALFRFFDEDEWARLLNRGGRVGELAKRAGAHQELEKVRKQLEEMRAKSRQRLGEKFEMLMGQEHEYGYFDDELVQRYVCLGDDAEDGAPNAQQGRFADITKSADLYFGQPELPHRLCFRDTPGVNDTFMIREQITVNAIRKSRLCVVVLSAHQAMSTVDMALIRLISNIKSREVIIFVNRIDELADPVNDAKEIHHAILETLKAHNGPTDARVIFGSAYWAAHALEGRYEDLSPASSEALVKWAEVNIKDDEAPDRVEEMIWQLSGVPALCDAIARRVDAGEGAEFLDRATRAASNIAKSIVAANIVDEKRASDGAKVKPVPPEQIGDEVEAIAERSFEALDDHLDTLISDLGKRLSGAQKSFLGRATSSLIKHLETKGENEVWTYDPSGLRVLLRSGYQVFSGRVAKATQAVFEQAARDIQDLYVGAFKVPPDQIALEPPAVPRAPAPVILGSTIALDVRGNWWKKWWQRRRSYSAFAEEFAELIEAELQPFVASIQKEHAETYADAISTALEEFLRVQGQHILELAQKSGKGPAQVRAVSAGDKKAKFAFLRSSLEILAELNPPKNKEAA